MTRLARSSTLSLRLLKTVVLLSSGLLVAAFLLYRIGVIDPFGKAERPSYSDSARLARYLKLPVATVVSSRTGAKEKTGVGLSSKPRRVGGLSPLMSSSKTGQILPRAGDIEISDDSSGSLFLANSMIVPKLTDSEKPTKP